MPPRTRLLIPVLLAVAALEGAIAVSARLSERAAAAADDPDRAVAIYGRAQRLFPWNDRAAAGLGTAWFDRASADLGDAAVRDAALRESAGQLVRGLRLNPGSLKAHLQFARTLLTMDYVGLTVPADWFGEFEKAARLTGVNSQVLFDVGQVLLSRWESLSPPRRAFTRDILRKALAGLRPGRLEATLASWDMNGRDYELIEAILPDDPASLRTYGKFLGERSLSLERRESALARAEALEFARAKDEAAASERSLEYYQLGEARRLAREASALLAGIRFHRPEGADLLVPADEYAALALRCRLLSARISIEETGTLDQALPDLRAYIDTETDVSALAALEASLRERGLLPSRAGLGLEDLPVLMLDLSLAFHQNRYQELTVFGRSLETRFLAVPSDRAAEYARMLGVLAEAFLKLDLIYDAERFAVRASEQDPRSLDVLLLLRRIYDRMNNEPKARDVEARLAAALTPPETAFPGTVLDKGIVLPFPVVSNGGRAEIAVTFEPSEGAPRPLISAVLDGRVAWEGYLGPDDRLAFSAELAPGTHALEITPVNRAARLARIGVALAGAPAVTAAPEAADSRARSGGARRAGSPGRVTRKSSRSPLGGGS